MASMGKTRMYHARFCLGEALGLLILLPSYTEIWTLRSVHASNADAIFHGLQHVRQLNGVFQASRTRAGVNPLR